MTDPAAFAEARLDEDEAAAKATSPSGKRLTWRASHERDEEGTLVHWVLSDLDVSAAAQAMGLERETGAAVAEHIARHDPARALREVEASRRILERHRDCIPWGNGPCEHAGTTGEPPCPDMRDLLCRWDDHPDYDPEWRP